MVVAFLPFPTAVLASAFHASDRAERVAIGFYGGTALIIDLLLRASVRYAISKPELTTEPEALPQRESRRSAAGERGWRELLASAVVLCLRPGAGHRPQHC